MFWACPVRAGFTNTETLTGTAQWGKSAAKISDNLEDWADKVLTNGFAIMGKTALRNFLADEKISKMLDNRRVEMGLIHPRDLPNGVKYVGHLNSPNIDIYTYAEVYLDDWTDPAAPKTLPLVPENKVVLIASHPDYMMAYAPTMAAPKQRRNPLQHSAMTGMTVLSRPSRPAKRMA